VTGMVPLQKRVGKKLDGGIRTVEESHCAEDGVADIAALRHYMKTVNWPSRAYECGGGGGCYHIGYIQELASACSILLRAGAQ
jgi:hypothetical protein